MVKQVIVIRKDLKMRRGKEISQGAHASMAWLTERIRSVSHNAVNIRHQSYLYRDLTLSNAEVAWVQGPFTKICLQVDSEQALDEIYTEAKIAGLETHMITDLGATEFHGVPTKTCLAIGPDEAEKIDVVVGKLKLY